MADAVLTKKEKVMKRYSLMDLFVFIIWMAPLIYLGFTYPSLPNTVAVHFNIDGQADRMGNKSEVATGVCILSAMSAGIYLLMKYLPKIDPKRNAKTSPSVFKKVGHAIVLLMSCIGIAITYSAVAGKFTFDKWMLPAMGLFFAYMGNVMYNIKPNYFAGIRTPWALEDEGNWKETHRLASKLWFAGGIVITIGTLFLPNKIGLIYFMSIVAFITIIPFAYSYHYYKNRQAKK